MGQSPDEILAGLAETHREKEADYGAAWKTVGHMLYLLAGEEPVEIDSPEDWIRIGLYYERLIKIARAFNGEFVAEEMNFEAIRDSHEDDAVYAVMHASTHGVGDGE